MATVRGAQPGPKPTTGTLSPWILPLICATQFLLTLDFSIVNVALPTVQRELGFSAASLPWVVTGYAMTYGSLLLLGGRIGDSVGHRQMIIIGLTVFAIASLTGGLAADPLMLVLSRIAQGAGAAAVAPSALAILTGSYTQNRARARAMGIFQAATSAGATAGIVIGGIFVELINWRSVLLVNPPLIVLLLVLIIRELPKTAPSTARQRLDIPGAALITISVAALIYGLSQGQEHGFAAVATITTLIVAIAAGLGFVIVERRMANPMVPGALFNDATRRGGLIVAFLLGLVVFGYAYFVSLYLQRVLRYTSLRTGLALVPATLTVMTVSMFLTRRLLSKIGMRGVLATGLLLFAAGQTWLSQITDHSTYTTGVLPGLLLIATGMGLSIPAVAIAANSNITTDLRGIAGGMFVTAQQVGAAIGIAALATIAAARSDSADGSLVTGYRLAFAIAAAIAILALLLALTIIRRPMTPPAQATAAQPTTAQPHPIAAPSADI